MNQQMFRNSTIILRLIFLLAAALAGAAVTAMAEAGDNDAPGKKTD